MEALVQLDHSPAGARRAAHSRAAGGDRGRPAGARRPAAVQPPTRGRPAGLPRRGGHAPTSSSSPRGGWSRARAPARLSFALHPHTHHPRSDPVRIWVQSKRTCPSTCARGARPGARFRGAAWRRAYERALTAASNADLGYAEADRRAPGPSDAGRLPRPRPGRPAHRRRCRRHHRRRAGLRAGRRAAAAGRRGPVRRRGAGQSEHPGAPDRARAAAGADPGRRGRPRRRGAAGQRRPGRHGHAGAPVPDRRRAGAPSAGGADRLGPARPVG